MTDIDKAKMLLPDMPEEVFDLWIRHCISKNGWPYDSMHCSGDVYWEGYFLNRPLPIIRNFKWERTSVRFCLSMFESSTQVFLDKLKRIHTNKSSPAIEGVAIPEDSKLRYLSVKSFIEEKNEIPDSIILLSTPSGFEIFDGWHRLTAIYAMQELLPPLELPCWIAS